MNLIKFFESATRIPFIWQKFRSKWWKINIFDYKNCVLNPSIIGHFTLFVKIWIVFVLLSTLQLFPTKFIESSNSNRVKTTSTFDSGPINVDIFSPNSLCLEIELNDQFFWLIFLTLCLPWYMKYIGVGFHAFFTWFV